jgi:hypothetical protein
VCFNGYRRIYVGFLKERCVHLEKDAIYGLYIISDFFRFFCSCISLNGPSSMLWEPLFNPNKIISVLVFPPSFSRGIYPKILVFMCALYFFFVSC